MIVYMEVDPDDTSRVIGYVANGQRYATLEDIPRPGGWLRREGVSISADTVFMNGRPVNMAALIAQEYDAAKLRAELDYATDSDEVTRALWRWSNEP